MTQPVSIRNRASAQPESLPSLSAQKHDWMNDLLSLGVHRLWKRFVLALSGVTAGQQILNLSGGTGDLALRLARMTGKQGLVVSTDAQLDFLQVGRERLFEEKFSTTVQYAQLQTGALPFPAETFHCVTVSFDFQNRANKANTLQEIYRVLRPQGRLLLLEFSKPNNLLFSKLYDTYALALPWIGQWLTENKTFYQSWSRSIRQHTHPADLKRLMQQAGFERCDYHTLSGGIVAVHRGFRV